jgi:hypothetical protein
VSDARLQTLLEFLQIVSQPCISLIISSNSLLVMVDDTLLKNRRNSCRSPRGSHTSETETSGQTACLSAYGVRPTHPCCQLPCVQACLNIRIGL